MLSHLTYSACAGLLSGLTCILSDGLEGSRPAPLTNTRKEREMSLSIRLRIWKVKFSFTVEI